jgi:hypothetical protein
MLSAALALDFRERWKRRERAHLRSRGSNRARGCDMEPPLLLADGVENGGVSRREGGEADAGVHLAVLGGFLMGYVGC